MVSSKRGWDLPAQNWALMSFDGPVGSINRHEIKGPSKDMRFLGPSKDMRF